MTISVNHCSQFEKRFQKIAILLLAVILAGGCSFNTARLYSGGYQSAEQAAVVKTANDIAIHYIDNERVFIYHRNWWVPFFARTKAEVIPGQRTLRVAYAGSGWQGGWSELTATLDGGRSYVVNCMKMEASDDSIEDGIRINRAYEQKVVKVWIEQEDIKEKIPARIRYLD